jgi:hypothetical protein
MVVVGARRCSGGATCALAISEAEPLLFNETDFGRDRCRRGAALAYKARC